jgi:hypothetical protein
MEERRLLRGPPRDPTTTEGAMRAVTVLARTLLCVLLIGAGCRPSPALREAPREAREETRAPDDEAALERIPELELGAMDRSPDGLVRMALPEIRGLVYIRKPRPDFERYSQMILEPISLSYREAAPRFRDQDHELLARQFRADVMAAIEAGPDWDRVYQPGPDVVLVRVGLLDIDVEPDLGRFVGSAVNYANAGGGAILTFELADSQTGDPLYRYIDRRALPAGTYPGSDVDRIRLSEAFSGFAGDLAVLLQRQEGILGGGERRPRTPGDP